MAKHKVEIYSAGCATCEETIAAVQQAAGPAWEVIVHDMKKIEVAKRAKALNIHSVPAVVIEGMLASCCAGRGVDLEVLRATGLGRP
jgi:hypothetical protein